MRTQTPRMILLGAAKYLREHPWQKQHMGVHGGPRCAFGALLSASGSEEWQGVGTPLGYAAEAVRDELFRRYGRGYTIYNWNDYVAKDKAEVIEVFEHVADHVVDPQPWTLDRWRPRK